MNKTWKDIVVGKMGNIIKKHKFLKAPMLCGVIVVSGVFWISNGVTRNIKRLTSIVAVALVFVISSSFTFPSYSEHMQTGAQIVMDSLENYSDVADNAIAFEDISKEDNDVLQGIVNEDEDIVADEDKFGLDDILESDALAMYGNSEEVADGYGDVELSASDWNLILVNKLHPVPDDYEFTLGTIKGSMQCDVRIIDDLRLMLQAAKADGVNLLVCSPHRNLDRQVMLFNRKINYYMNKGYSYMNAYMIASKVVTIPGTSEHQIGLALDIYSDSYNQLDAGFGETPAGIWLKEHAKEYGFILRYPEGKENVTGIEYEPWHYRYVGRQAAPVIMDNDLTLEEFLQQLE